MKYLEDEREGRNKEVCNLKEDVEYLALDNVEVKMKENAENVVSKIINPGAVLDEDEIQIDNHTKNSGTVELPKVDSDIEMDFINQVKHESCQRQ